MCEEWPDPLIAAVAPYAFDGPAAATVRALKYGRWRETAAFMADAMAPLLAELLDRVACAGEKPPLVPVPLTPARRRERGFNQAAELSRHLARLTGLPELTALRRRPGGRRQARLPGRIRRANVQGRFEPACPATGRGPLAVLVDDVMTTGATAIACAESLAQAGFRRVAVVTFARTLRPLDERRAERLVRHHHDAEADRWAPCPRRRPVEDPQTWSETAR